MKEHNNLVILC